MPDQATAAVTETLLAQRAAFRGFLLARVGNAADADDLLQQGLVQALQHADEIRDGEKAVAWFYRVLRHALVDHARSRAASVRREEAWAADSAALSDDATTQQRICSCFEALLPTLKPSHAALLRRVELQGEPVAQVAQALGLTPNHASVQLHRARAALRSKLVAFCGSCAEDACLDCACEPEL